MPAGELCRFEGINDIKMQGGFFPEDKGRPIRATVSLFIPLRLPKKITGKVSFQ